MTDININIWVVDDDPSVCNALKRLIKSAGFSVRTCSSAQKFLDDGHMENTGLLILDVKMPGLSGLELQEKLTAAGSNTPIIFITAQDNGNTRTTAMEKGAMAFLHKPFDEQDLLKAIYAGIEQSESQNETNTCC